MPRGINQLRPSGKRASSEIFLGLWCYPTLESAADSISCLVGFEAVTAKMLRHWVEVGPDALGTKLHRLLVTNPDRIQLGEKKHLLFQLEEAAQALKEVKVESLALDRAKMRIDFALHYCKQNIRAFKYRHARIRRKSAK